MEETRLRAHDRAGSALSIGVRQALRGIRRRPGFAAIVVSTLAVGIGASTVVFSLVRSVLLKPLPYRDPDRLVRIYEDHGTRSRFTWGQDASYIIVRPATLHAWREQSRSFEGIAALRWRTKTLGGDEARSVWANEVTPEFFRVAGVAAALGRTLEPDDYVAGVPRAAVLSDALWRARYGSDPGIVGRMVTIDGSAVPVVGVMPRGFYPDNYLSADIWVPYVAPAGEAGDRSTWSFITLARLRPGVEIEQACRDLDLVSARLAAAYPDDYGNMSAVVVPVAGEVVGPHERLLLTLLGAVGLVLLIACGNVANLMLARATERGRELAVRAALGATRVRLFGELAAESLLLAVCGGVGGVVLAVAALRPAMALLPAERGIPRIREAALDGPVLAFTIVVSLLTALAFGMAPAWRASRPGIEGVLRDGGRGSGPGRSARRFGSALIAGEVALAAFLLAGSGLLLRSFWLLHQVDPGFRSGPLLALQFTVPSHRYGEYQVGGANPPRAALFREMEREISTLPGVESAAITNLLPLKHGPNPWAVSVEGRGAPAPSAEDGPARTRRGGRYHHGTVSIERVTPGYFGTLGMPLLAGRLLDESDTEGRPLVTVVNETLARKLFPGEDPVGRRLTADMTSYFPTLTIVGVVADIRMHGLDSEPYPLLFWSAYQFPGSGAWLVVKTRGGTASVASAVRDAVRRTDPEIALKEVVPMDDVVAGSLWRQRFSTLLLGLFAGLASSWPWRGSTR
jgi:putative ABC transport system permease protein